LGMFDQETDYDEGKVYGYIVTLEKIKSWRQRLASLSVEQRQALRGMQPKRADVIVAGLSILEEAMDFFGKKEITVSTKGVRYGLALMHDKI
ncbi:MAG: hypothetical protein KDD34_07185, partial [Bdellovibrionales bacterium]|nr:hypothetical protein [Bdellovibrionales bacterium]